jgi:hypothetical protein
MKYCKKEIKFLLYYFIFILSIKDVLSVEKTETEKKNLPELIQKAYHINYIDDYDSGIKRRHMRNRKIDNPTEGKEQTQVQEHKKEESKIILKRFFINYSQSLSPTYNAFLFNKRFSG